MPEAAASGDEHARFLKEIKAACERVARQVAEAVGDGQMPLVLGGDHSVALGTLGGMAAAERRRAPRSGSTRTAT